MIYLTGDCHGNMNKLEEFGDIISIDHHYIIILGDSGINYYLNNSDTYKKQTLSDYSNITFLIVHGNHECRAENISTYKKVKTEIGEIYLEKKYKNIYFLISGNEYIIEGQSFLCIGGAYSVDKEYRLLRGYAWWKDEILSETERENILSTVKPSYDYLISHTCPVEYLPTDMFLPFVDQSKVDNTMELFLSEIIKRVKVKKIFCGHFHCDRDLENIRFMYNDFIKISDK